MKVLLASSEAVPFVKTGGLADVTGSLQRELINIGVDARIMLPLYRGIKSRFKLEDTGHRLRIPLGSRTYEGRLFSLGDKAYFIECKEFFDRQEIYGTSRGEYNDNAFRFIFFSKAVPEACKAIGFIPDVMHSNDWETGLVPLYLRTIHRDAFKGTASLFTIHNLGYQGRFPASAMTLTGLPQEMFNPEELEFYGQLNLLKAGIVSADALSTVSMTYAREIMQEEYGFGLEGVLKNRAKDLSGILNGLDQETWNPENDPFLRCTFGHSELSGKLKCKDYLVERCSFTDEKAPLAGMVGRIASQKGIDIFLNAAEKIFSLGVNVIVLGKGQESLQKKLMVIARKHKSNFSLVLGYDESLAHLVYAGADMFFIPSYYEPCGLTQMIAMRYGTVPVARATGGIADTVEDYDHLKSKGNGFLFSGYEPSSLLESVKRALCVYSNSGKWQDMASEGMKKDFSWKVSAKKYIVLYEGLVKKVRK